MTGLDVNDYIARRHPLGAQRRAVTPSKEGEHP
jgi:hypothetical protein